jgi:dolichyl-phosphate beta-glucosyltransferase
MYNENRVIADTAKTLSAYMEAHYQDYELLFCSDGSTDGCDQTVRSLNLPNVRVIGYEQNRGKGCAVRTAMLAATGDVRMFLDADLAYGIDVIDRVFQFFAAGREEQVVVGSRNLQKDGYAGYTFLRKIASKTYIRVLGFVGGFRLSDSQCGCKAFSATAAQEIFSRCEIDGFAFDIETILWATKLEIKIAEIPVRVIRHSDSKVRLLRDTFRMLRDLTKAKKRIQKK